LAKGSTDSAGLLTLKTKNQDAFFGRPIADCSATLARKVRQASALQPRPELSMQNPIGDATHVFTERVPSRRKHRCPGTVKQPINCCAPSADADGRLTTMI
jgi:hypothetical protein